MDAAPSYQAGSHNLSQAPNLPLSQGTLGNLFTSLSIFIIADRSLTAICCWSCRVYRPRHTREHVTTSSSSCHKRRTTRGLARWHGTDDADLELQRQARAPVECELCRIRPWIHLAARRLDPQNTQAAKQRHQRASIQRAGLKLAAWFNMLGGVGSRGHGQAMTIACLAK